MKQKSVTYRIVVTINGSQVAVWPSVVLAPQNDWDQLIPTQPEETNTLYIKAQIYRADKPSMVYREVHMTLDISGEGKDRKVNC